MSRKDLLPNQCDVLHEKYGANDCCLCRARDEAAHLRQENVRLREQNDRLQGVIEYATDALDAIDALLKPLADVRSRVNDALEKIALDAKEAD